MSSHIKAMGVAFIFVVYVAKIKKIKGLAKRFGVDEEQFLKLLEELTDNG